MTEWTEVKDPTTLNEGDKIRAEGEDFTLRCVLMEPPRRLEDGTHYVVYSERLGTIYVPEGAEFFLAEEEFAILTGPLEEGTETSTHGTR